MAFLLVLHVLFSGCTSYYRRQRPDLGFMLTHAVDHDHRYFSVARKRLLMSAATEVVTSNACDDEHKADVAQLVNFSSKEDVEFEDRDGSAIKYEGIIGRLQTDAPSAGSINVIDCGMKICEYVLSEHLDELCTYDQAIIGYNRRRFLEEWMNPDFGISLVATRYASGSTMICGCLTAQLDAGGTLWISPLHADNQSIALHLIKALTSTIDNRGCNNGNTCTPVLLMANVTSSTTPNNHWYTDALCDLDVKFNIHRYYTADYITVHYYKRFAI